MRLSLVLALALVTAPAAAQADVTVFYPEPAPHAPLVATPVPGAEPVAVAAAAEAPSAPAPVGSVEPVEPPVVAEAVRPVGSVEQPARCEVPSPVRFIRTTDGSREARLLHLTDCHGAPDAEALLDLSILARPRTAERPSEHDLEIHRDDAEYFATEVRRLDPGLLVRLQRIADRFPGHDIEITSGYRPDARETSRHRTGHALDLRVVDAPIEDVHALAVTFDESGVGLYPTSEFLHVDVRPRVTHWVDLAGPGEPANMVEVVNGRDGLASSAAPLRWPASPDGVATSDGVTASPAASSPSPTRRRRSARPADHRAALREALEALDALENLDLNVP